MANWTKRLADRFRTYRTSLRTDLSTPDNRRRALAYQRWMDHGFLRVYWTNMHQIAPDVWRSNHPTPDRFARLSDMGIRTIVSLRGSATAPWALLEQEACAAAGITLETVALQSRAAPPKAELQKLIALFRRVEKPLLIHCKSGADRAGLASAIYLLVIEQRPLAQARRMLSLRYIHLKWSKTGVLDLLLDTFEASGEPDFEVWLDRDYDAAALQAAFQAR
ncbi:MAG: tyrosine-protein phosphatase [Octadecabacter sp.]|nr:tyrosine-protein phosphatase [Octadecabacter sp.]